MGLSLSRRNHTGRRRQHQQQQPRRNLDVRHSQAPSLPSTANPTTHQAVVPSSSSSSSSNTAPLNGSYPAHPSSPVPSGSRGFAPAKKIKNDVNVHKDSIRISADDNHSDSFLVSFTFDALVDGSITIFYFAKEGVNCTFTPLHPEYYTPAKIPFQKGLDQKFLQPSGTGIDLGFFERSELSNSRTEEEKDVFPLVIYVETCFASSLTDVDPGQHNSTTSPHAHITQAVLDETRGGQFQVRVINQILWIDEVRYELREIYGIGNHDNSGFDDSESGKECVICMIKPKDTAVLPCRHMCMCSVCARKLRVKSNRCPFCRELIQELILISDQR